MKRLLLPIAAAVALAGCGEPPAEIAPRVRPVEWIEVGAESAGRERTFSGTAQSGQEAGLSFRVNGRVSAVHVTLGDRVEVNARIAELEPTDYRLGVEESAAAVSQQISNLRSATTTYDRTRALYENNNASVQDLDLARAGFETAEAGVRAAEKALQRARRQLGYTALKAPATGYISSVAVEPNENVQAGQVVAVLSTEARPEVRVAIPEGVIGDLDQGAAVSVRFDAIAEVVPGTVKEIGMSALSQGATFPVTISLGVDDERIRPGMAADVTFTFQRDDAGGFVAVPAVAVGEDEGGRFAFVIRDIANGQGTVHRVTVSTGEITGVGLTIRTGITPGDKVVTRGVHKLTDGQVVRVPEPTS
jgi:RND family efflux transporter MFP subunit